MDFNQVCILVLFHSKNLNILRPCSSLVSIAKTTPAPAPAPATAPAPVLVRAVVRAIVLAAPAIALVIVPALAAAALVVATVDALLLASLVIFSTIMIGPVLAEELDSKDVPCFLKLNCQA